MTIEIEELCRGGGGLNPNDIILLIVRKFKRIERKSIQDVFHIVSKALKLDIQNIKFVQEFRRPHCSYLEYLIDISCSLGFLREDVERDKDLRICFYELTIDGEIICREIIKKDKRYLEIEKFIELLPQSKRVLTKISQALFIKEGNLCVDGWGITEDDVRTAIRTLAGLMKLSGCGGYEDCC
jgi:hypothetical protein